MSIDPDLFQDELQSLRAEAQQASRPDRLYPIRSEKYYGFYAGLLPDGKQSLIGIIPPDHFVALLFDDAGNLVEVQRGMSCALLESSERRIPVVHEDHGYHDFLKDKLGVTPTLNRVKAFEIREERHSIEPIPDHLAEFLEDPFLPHFEDEERQIYPAMIREFIAEGQFVLNWYNDYWLDQNGEVKSS